MSDDDFMLESDNEEYEFDYEDDGEEESPDVDIENRYYNAKQMKVSDPQAAVAEFLEVPKLETEKGDWCVLLSAAWLLHDELTSARCGAGGSRR